MGDSPTFKQWHRSSENEARATANLLHGIDGFVGEGPRATIALGRHVVHKFVEIFPLGNHFSLEPHL